MNDERAAFWLLACAIAVVIGAALKWGMLPSHAGGFIHRKKDPWTYWSTIGALGAILLACVVVAISARAPALSKHQHGRQAGVIPRAEWQEIPSSGDRRPMPAAPTNCC